MAAMKSLVSTVGFALRCNAAYPSYTCVVLIGLIKIQQSACSKARHWLSSLYPMAVLLNMFLRRRRRRRKVLCSIGNIAIGTTNYINLILMCPVLEELFIHNGDTQTRPPSWITHLQTVYLKRLVIYFHVPKCIKAYEDRVAVLAPNLAYFEFSGYVSSFYIPSRMPLLVEARLDIRLWESTICYDEDGGDIYEDAYYYPVNGFSVFFGDTTCSLKTLHLSPHSLEAIHFCCEDICVFESLLTLSFESDEKKGWQVVPRLLKRAPNLQTLVINGLVHRVTDKCGDVCPDLHRKNDKVMSVFGVSKKESCLRKLAVKLVEISGYGGTRGEVQQMRHFLRNLKCLELVKIGVQKEADNKMLRRKLMRLVRFSSKCNIHFI